MYQRLVRVRATRILRLLKWDPLVVLCKFAMVNVLHLSTICCHRRCYSVPSQGLDPSVPW